MKRKQIWKLLICLVVIIIAGAAGFIFLLERQNYGTINTLNYYENTSVENVSYQACLGGVLKYSRNGISMLNEKGEEIWNQSCQMNTPVIDIREEAVIVYDKGGTSILVLGEEGLEGEMQTTRPIEKANVSKQGIVAALLKDETHPLVMCYDMEGNVLVKQSTSLKNTGYPLDIAISEDGNMLLVSYLLTKGNSVTSKVVYYDFSSGDIDKKDYQIRSDEYENSIIPVAAFLDKDTSLLVADNALIYYDIKKVPEVTKEIETKNILNVAYNNKMVATLVKDEETSECTMLVYDQKGELLSETSIEREYTHIKLDDGQVILYEDNMCAIYTKDGICKFEGKMDVEILEIFPMTGLNKYMMINANGFYEIRLAK